MKCTDCSGLILWIQSGSKTIIKDNLFKDNTAREATCVYIEDNRMNYSNKSSDL